MLALLPLALSLAPQIAKWLGGDTAAAVTSQVGGIIQTVTGTADPAEAEAVLMADPAKRAEVQIKLAEIAAAREAAQLEDTANARAQQLALVQANSWLAWGAPMVSVAVLGLFTYVVVSGAVLEVDIRETLKNLAVACVGYWIGSSRGSAAKDEVRR